MADKRSQSEKQHVDSKTRARQRIINRALEVFGDRDKAMSWLEQPSVSGTSGQLRPRILMVDTDEGFREVEEWLVQIEHGMYR